MSNALRILANLDDQDLVWLREVGEFRRLPPGETLIKVDRPLYDLFFVLDGDVAVTAGDGRRVARLEIGEVVGEMSFVEEQLPQTTVEAISDTRVLAIGHAVIRARLAADTAFAARFYRALALFLSSRLRNLTAGGAAPPAGGTADEADFGRLIALLDGD